MHLSHGLWITSYMYKNSGGEEIIKDGDGYILPIRDIEALKKKILYLYENKSVCNQMGKWLKKINNVFSWERYGKNAISTYDKLLNL